MADRQPTPDEIDNLLAVSTLVRDLMSIVEPSVRVSTYYSLFIEMVLLRAVSDFDGAQAHMKSVSAFFAKMAEAKDIKELQQIMSMISDIEVNKGKASVKRRV